jgi:drug/metabolite transporter (DMT)-like permease
MSWLLIVIIAHILNSLDFIFTKVLLEKVFGDSRVLAILVGAVSGLAALLIFFPLGFVVPAFPLVILNLASGSCFIAALLFFYRVLKKYEATRVVPVIGGGVPFFTFILSAIFLRERLSLIQLAAFFLLLVGTVIISIDKSKTRLTLKAFLEAAAASFLFALAYFLTKFAFDTQPFWSAFIWIRLGSFLAAVILILLPKNRALFRGFTKKINWRILLPFAGIFCLTALAFVMLNYAISIASVSLVNALQGVQYAFLVLLVIVGKYLFPKYIKEKIGSWVLVQKIAAIILIGAAVGLLSI